MIGSCGCLQWNTWPELFGMKYRGGAGAYILSYFMYVVWAIILAALASMMVRVFAPYACGSGIPEVNNMFIIQALFTSLQ